MKVAYPTHTVPIGLSDFVPTGQKTSLTPVRKKPGRLWCCGASALARGNSTRHSITPSLFCSRPFAVDRLALTSCPLCLCGESPPQRFVSTAASATLPLPELARTLLLG